MAQSVVTASRLSDGVVVWFAAPGDWREDFDQARPLEGDALAAAMDAATADAAANHITDLHAAELDAEGRPVEPRERIRADGPSVRRDLAHIPRPSPGHTLPPPPSASERHAPHAGIYHYDETDRAFLQARAARFADQVARRCRGELSEEEFKPLRLMNGLYLQLHGYMLRVAIPYGVLSSLQLRQLAYVAQHYDRGYGHFTTRQNIQFNWPRLDQSAEILSVLAAADLHAIQTSGNCIRNVTTDPYAGAAADELVDPRIWGEILRQWSTDHPEFTFLPRKFKIAITGATHDRAAIKVHDIGIIARRNEAGEIGFCIYAGGGLGRTPLIGTKLRDFVPVRDLLRYVEAILRVYNALGRRDNLYKARIKILLRDMKPEIFIGMVDAAFAALPADHAVLDEALIADIAARFPTPPLTPDLTGAAQVAFASTGNAEFGAWVRSNTHPHRVAGHVCVAISLKPQGGIPGDASADEMRLIADLADRFSLGEIRVAHEQNLVLPHVRMADLSALWGALRAAGLAAGNIGQASDMICCPGMDYCALATARSIPVAQRLSTTLSERGLEARSGQMTINMSGCINACGHHHVGNIGLLGVDRNGEEVYQITLGGAADETAAIGQIIGPAVPTAGVVDAVTRIIDAYLAVRQDQERFIDTYRRVGPAPFKEAVYAHH